MDLVIATLLTFLFVGLKLFGSVSWSWVVVFSPALAWFALVLVIFGFKLHTLMKDKV